MAPIHAVIVPGPGGMGPAAAHPSNSSTPPADRRTRLRRTP